MLTILSSMAENESVSISANEKWSVQKRFQEGTYVISYPPYGYKNIDGEMVVVPEQKEVILRIFREALSGKGTRSIALGLNADGIPAKKGGLWRANTIKDILRNEKYTGDALLQKTYTDSSFNRHKNNGELNQYLVENHHEAIISHEDYEKVQSMISHHAKENNIEKGIDKYQRRYAFSGRIICGGCGGTYRRRMNYKPSGDYAAWTCSRHLDDKSGCRMKYIKDESIKSAFITMMNKLRATQKYLLKPFVQALGKIDDKERLLKLSALEERIEKNIEQRQALVGFMTNGILEPAVFNTENNALAVEAKDLQDEKEQLIRNINSYLKQSEEAYKLLKFLSKNDNLHQFDDELFLEYVENITVVSRKQIVFNLKCGLKLSERLVE